MVGLYRKPSRSGSRRLDCANATGAVKPSFWKVDHALQSDPRNFVDHSRETIDLIGSAPERMPHGERVSGAAHFR